MTERYISAGTSQRLVDQLVYNEQGNEVLLIKYLDLEPQASG
jgi:hypothetical protein